MNYRALFLLCLLVLIATVTADEKAQKAKLKSCVLKEMDKENKEAAADLKLSPSELQKLKTIVTTEIDKEPLKKHNDEEQAKCFKEMEDAAKKDLPTVSQEAVDKILHKVNDMSMHCLKEMGL